MPLALVLVCDLSPGYETLRDNMENSRIPGFFRLSVKERRASIRSALPDDGAYPPDAERILEGGGLSTESADQIVENVLGIYSLPLGVALNARVNGQDRLIPMVVEEPSVIAAASNACKMIRVGGGFEASMQESLMISQIELREVPNIERAQVVIASHASELLEKAARALPGLVRRGGGPRAIETRVLAPDHLVVHLLVDCRDAMGANLVNTAAEALSPELAELTQSKPGLRILSNLSDRRLVQVSVKVPGDALLAPKSSMTSGEVLDAIEAASVFAERDPYRAATHNKGIMNGLDSVVIATGNDYRAVEAGAHAYAARSGRYSPLATWRRVGGRLHGEMRVPLALGIVGGTLRVHPGARLGLALSEAKTADDLALLAACAGLASNLAAIRALATEGIQRGHMSLHARSVAVSAGAEGEEVNVVAAVISSGQDVTLAAAKAALEKLRADKT